MKAASFPPERREMYARPERENRRSMDGKNERMVSIALRRRELNHSGKKRGH